jgi:hypothetical protein
MKADPVPAVVKDSVPVTHWVNLWMQPSGTLKLGSRYDSILEARTKTDGENKRICILRITTNVEIA